MGLASTKVGRSIAQRLVRIRQKGGKQAGAFLRYRPGTDILEPVPQLGFSTSPDGPFEWFRTDDLPTAQELAEKGYRPSEAHVRSGGLSSEEARRHLGQLGFDVRLVQDLPPELDPDNTLLVEFEGTITTAVLRSVAKIAFNYLTFKYPALSTMEQFGRIRNFVRHDEPTRPVPVAVSDTRLLAGIPDDRQLLTHVVAVHWDPKEAIVVGEVSFFSLLTYRVRLSEGRFLVLPEFVSSGHLYDPLNHQIARLSRTPPRDGAPEIPMVHYDEHRRRSQGPSGSK